MPNSLRSFGHSIEEALAARENVERDTLLTAEVAGKEITIFVPTGEELTVMSMTLASAGPSIVKMGDLLSTLSYMMSDEDRAHVMNALRVGALKVDEDGGIVDLLSYIVEESTARPTRPSSASSPSSGRTGTSSTAGSRRVRSTPGTSLR